VGLTKLGLFVGLVQGPAGLGIDIAPGVDTEFLLEAGIVLDA
jgi:hypothetical protein